MRGVSFYMDKDTRIKKVWDFAKKEYGRANLPQHNFGHVLRDLYRTLVIAETEKGADYSILIPAVLLHDIGITGNIKDYSEHAEMGPPIIKRVLPEMGYSNEETEKICYCVRYHKGSDIQGNAVKLETKEAQIVFDADVLEKSSLVSTFFSARMQMETGKPLDEFLEKILDIRKKEPEFYTKKAKEIDGGGKAERIELFKRMQQELETRKDFLVTEKDVL